MSAKSGISATYSDAWLIDGVRTPFVDYNGPLAQVSPIDLGIKAAREAFRKTGAKAADVGTTITGNMAQASFDAYMLPRHIGLYAGVSQETPAHMVQRVCGTGIEVLAQASDATSLGRAELALCVGTESMSRNPIAAYTHRGGFRMGQVEFKDFLWEALLDPGCGCTMGDTAENLAKQYQITRAEVDAFAARSFDRAVKAQASGFLAGEIRPRRARLDGHRHVRAHQVHPAAGQRAATGHELVDRIGGEKHHIERLTGRDALGGIHAAHRFDGHGHTRNRLVSGRQFGQHLAGGHRRDSLDRHGRDSGRPVSRG